MMLAPLAMSYRANSSHLRIRFSSGIIGFRFFADGVLLYLMFFTKIKIFTKKQGLLKLFICGSVLMNFCLLADFVYLY